MLEEDFDESRARRRKSVPALAGLALLACSTTAEEANLYRNEEFALEATFPAGTHVCQARSGDHPHGFYVWLNQPTDCQAAAPGAGIRAMGIYASYNTDFDTSPADELPCPAGTVPPGIPVDVSGLSIAGLTSLSCATLDQDGRLTVVVAAQGGEWGPGDRSPESAAPRINYAASLVTRREHVERDMQAFRAFLSSIRMLPEHHSSSRRKPGARDQKSPRVSPRSRLSGSPQSITLRGALSAG